MPSYEVTNAAPIDLEHVVFETFQRSEVVQLVKEMVAAWHEPAIGTITLAWVHENKWSVVDGGQRVRAAWRLDIPTLPACLHKGLDYEQRAHLFSMMDHRKNLTAYNKYVARLEKKDTVALTVKSVTESLGYKVVESGQDHPREIRAISTMLRIVEEGGRDMLLMVLGFAQEWIPEDAVKIDTLGGLHEFLRYKDPTEIAHALLTLKKWSVQEVEALIAHEESKRGRVTRGSGSAGKWKKAFQMIIAGNVKVEDLSKILHQQVVRKRAPKKT